MSVRYPRIGSKQRVWGGRCIVCRYTPQESAQKMPGRPLFRVEVEHSIQRGDDSTFNVCQKCFVPSAGDLLAKIANANRAMPAKPLFRSNSDAEIGAAKERMRIVQEIRRRVQDRHISMAQVNALISLEDWVKGGGA